MITLRVKTRNKVLHTLHPALEDGTGRGFRNVGKPQSDAGETPKKYIQYSKHGESLKSRMLFFRIPIAYH